MENIIMLILGVFISVVGIVNTKGNISTIHSYNRRKVKEEDIPKYGKTVGTGTLIIGISLVLGFIVSFWSKIIIDYIILPAVIVGLGFILYGQFKYNKGIFWESGRYKDGIEHNIRSGDSGSYLLFAMLLEPGVWQLNIRKIPCRPYKTCFFYVKFSVFICTCL